ncbi:MAG: hypothetical protein RLY85_1717 [Bacteroidota bacterium]|jgi:hypothetical protein
MQNSVQTNKPEEITIGQLIAKVRAVWKFLLSKWVRIFLVGTLGAVLGFVYAFLTPIKYVSRLTFVVEESKGVGGGLSALAGQFGFDLGGGGGGGVFAGDNILLFLRSESLCRETLLTPYDDSGNVTLADRYAEVREFKKAWSNSKKVGNINFAKYASGPMPRLEDSLLQVIIRKNLLMTDLSVAKPDKKASFIQVAVSTRDEKLSALFSQRLVSIATTRYVESKTKLKAANVALLQRRADSLAALLNDKTLRAASSQQVLVDVNPALKTAPIVAEISTREKSMIGTIFAEVVKNLEIAKSILSQETPAIQMVDQSTFPLERVKASKLKALLLWGILFGMVYVFYLLASKWIKTQL